MKFTYWLNVAGGMAALVAVGGAGYLAGTAHRPSTADLAPSGRAEATGKPSVDPKLATAIHDYLFEHPEVLPEMSAALQQKQRAAFDAHARQAIDGNRRAIYGDGEDGIAGNPAGRVEVVEFFDYQCPFCKQLGPDLAKLAADNPDVRIVYKEFPILGGGSVVAARAALASVRQGKYTVLHDALIADRTPEHQLDEGRILDIARTAGLDVERLRADMASPDVAAKVDANLALGQKLGISGTPDLIVHDQVLQGLLPYDQLRKLVADKAAADLASGGIR